MSSPIVAIIGSPNVGKSTIFNRILGSRHSIVDDEAGVTRDRIYGKASWLNKTFTIIDTGGVEVENRPFQEQIRIQAKMAIDEADIIVFLVDGKLGLTSDDRMVAKMLYKVDKPIILAVNKIDDVQELSEIDEFYKLGLGTPIAISGAHGIGIGDMLDKIVTNLPDKKDDEFEDSITFSIIGRPNVGKSSLINAILNTERVIVSDISGTTRDSVDTPFTKNGQKYVAIDTAGLKKRGQIYESIDKYAAMRALSAIERSEIVLLVINAEEGIKEQDKHIVSYALDANKAIIIVVNKWDTVKKDQHIMDDFTKVIKEQFQFLDFAPIVYVSAKNRSRIEKIFKAIELVHEAYHKHISTSVLNEIFQDAQMMNEAPNFNGGRLKILFSNQVGVAPPTFVLFVNNPKFMHFSYQRYLENRLRDSYDFEGTPIKIILRQRS
jgi:GTP-binding protein